MGDLPLQGKGLAFGSGQLLHEDAFFDFKQVQRLTTYDPEVTTEPKLDHGHYEHLTALRQLDERIENESLDFVLCLFSLHYEPQWLNALHVVVAKLKKGGSLFLAEDRGFRAILDNSDGIHSTPQWLRDPIRRAFLNRVRPDNAAPWFPDISASDYGLVKRILVGFGSLSTPRTLSLKRKIDTTREPGCYLPWNEQRCTTLGDSAKELEAILKNVSDPVAEEITLNEWKKERDLPQPWNLSQPCSTAIWDAIAHRAATQISRIVVPDASNDHVRSAIRYRQAALQVLYFSLLRHFSCWKACELIIGALEDSTLAPALAKAEQWTVLERLPENQSERFLAAKLNVPQWLKDYAKKIEKGKMGWAGSSLYAKKQSGVYLWLDEACLCTPPSECVLISDDEKLAAEFKKREVPSCLYFLDALGSTHVSSPQAADRMYGATVIYLENGSYEQLDALLYCLRAVRSILVGRSAFLELQLKQDAANKFAYIKAPLATVGASMEQLGNLAAAVEKIQGALDDNFWHPGRAQLKMLEKGWDEYFAGERHEAFQADATSFKAKADTLRALQDECTNIWAGSRNRPRVKTLLRYFDSSYVDSNLLAAAAFAKTISKGRFPGVWVLACTNEEATKEQNSSEFLQWIASGITISGAEASLVSALLGLDMLCMKGEASASLSNQGLSVVILVRNDGRDGLDKFKKMIDDNTNSSTPPLDTSGSEQDKKAVILLRNAGAQLQATLDSNNTTCTVTIAFSSVHRVRTAENTVASVE